MLHYVPTLKPAHNGTENTYSPLFYSLQKNKKYDEAKTITIIYIIAVGKCIRETLPTVEANG